MNCDDPPELAKACDMLREIYWREYGRGWKAAIDGIKQGLEQQALAVDVDNNSSLQEPQK